MVICPRVCDYHHHHPEEEERLTTMVTTTGEVPLRNNDRIDCYGYHHAGSTTGEVIREETNDIVGLRHQTD